MAFVLQTVLAVISLTSSAIGMLKARKQRKLNKRAADLRKGYKIALDGEATNLPVLYGRGRIAGSRVYHHVSSDYIKVNDSLLVKANVFLSNGQSADLTTISPFYTNDVTSVSKQEYGGSGTTQIAIGLSQSEILFDVANNKYTIMAIPGQSANLPDYQFVNVTHKPFYAAVPSGTNTFLMADGTVVGLTEFLLIDVTKLYQIDSYDNSTGELILNLWDTISNISNGFSAGVVDLTKALDGTITGTKQEFLYVQQAICYGGIEGIYGVTVDEKRWDDYVFKDTSRYHTYVDPMTACDPMILANIPSRVDALFPEAAHADMVFRLNRDDPQYNDIPNVSFLAEGMKIRIVIRQGVWGSYTYTLSAQRAYSNNTALVVLDYLMSVDYGKGLPLEEIDLESFFNTAQICGRNILTLVDPENEALLDFWATIQQTNGMMWDDSSNYNANTGGIRLFETNYVLDTGIEVRENLFNLLETIPMAKLVWVDGVYSFNLAYPSLYSEIIDYEEGHTVQYPPDSAPFEVYRAKTDVSAGVFNPSNWTSEPAPGLTVATITDDDIVVEDDDVSSFWPSVDDRLNYFTVRFFNETKDFEEDSVSWPNRYVGNTDVHAAYLIQDLNKNLEDEIFLEGVTSYYHALNYAEHQVRDSRHSKNISIPVTKKFFFAVPGDLIRLNSDTMSIDELFVIEDQDTTQEGNIVFELKRFDARYLADNANDIEVVLPLTKKYSISFGDISALSIQQPTNLSELMRGAGTLSWSYTDKIPVSSYKVYTTSTKINQITRSTLWEELGSTTQSIFKLPTFEAGFRVFRVAVVDEKGSISPPFNKDTGQRGEFIEAYIESSSLLNIAPYVVDFYISLPSNEVPDTPTGASFIGGLLSAPVGNSRTWSESANEVVDETLYTTRVKFTRNTTTGLWSEVTYTNVISADISSGSSALTTVITSSSNGNVFRNNSGDNKVLTCKVYDNSNGSIIPAANITYLWFRNGVSLGVTTQSLTITFDDVPDNTAVEYLCQVSTE
jgi:hypothetical protein